MIIKATVFPLNVGFISSSETQRNLMVVAITVNLIKKSIRHPLTTLLSNMWGAVSYVICQE